MSNEITLQALLAQNAGSTIGTFVPDDRLIHTVENIRNGDIITEELLTDLKNRQDDIDTVITSRVAEIEDLVNIPTSIVEANFSSDPVTRSIRQYIIALIQKDRTLTRVGEGSGDQITIDANNGTKPVFRVYLNNKSVVGNYLRVYRNNGNGLTDFYEDGEILIEDSHTRNTITPNTNIETNVSGDQPAILDLVIPSNYTTLDPTRIQVGQNVDGLDTLIQDNEIDFSDRTQLIIGYTKQ